MRLFKYKGKRIRAGDRSLVSRFCALSLFSIFVIVVMLLNLSQLVAVDWSKFQLSDIFHLSTYNKFTLVIAVAVCGLAAFLYYYYRYDDFKKKVHRQKLSRMIL